MTPTATLLAYTTGLIVCHDGRGRSIKIRRLSALDTLRLLKAAGPALAQNQPWLSMAMLAVAVTEIDGVPVPTPATEAQIEALVDRLGEDGLEAVGDAYERDDSPVTGSDLGNSRGTLS